MPLVKAKASCFIDAIEVGLQGNAQTIARDYRDLLGNDPDIDPDTEGYHSSLVNQCLLERFGKGLTEIDLIPSQDGNRFPDCVTGYVTSWFKRPGFQCVVTGPRVSNGEEHANAYLNGQFFDSDGTPLEEPNIQLRTVWVLGIPVLQTEGETDAGQAEQTE